MMADGLTAFATSAAEQLELLATRAEAVLFLARPPREPADVALTLQHLAALLTPAAKADGKRLIIDGYGRSTPTSAPGQATRLALAAGLLCLLRDGSPARCNLQNEGGTVVRFSHESAVTCSLEPALAAVIEAHTIGIEGSGPDLILRFPRTS
jgi:hypothetical protein